MENARWGSDGGAFTNERLMDVSSTSSATGWTELKAAVTPTIGSGSQGVESRGRPCAPTLVDTSLEDAMSRFGCMSLGSTAAKVEQLRKVDDEHSCVGKLAMDSLRIEEASREYHPQGSCPSGAIVPWGTYGRVCQQQQQQHTSPSELAGGGQVVTHMRGVCPVGGGRGPDGLWRDEQGQRLYTEEEMREAVGHEGTSWRERNAELEASLSRMEREAREALQRAEQALSEMSEQLRASEGKTYALSVHLAMSNRPSHLA